MAQAQPEKIQDSPEKEMKMKETSNVSFRFNAQAPEFVPRSQTQMPISGYVYPCLHFLGGTAGCGSNLFYVGDQDPAYLISNPNVVPPNLSKTTQTNDLQQKINKQVIGLNMILHSLIYVKLLLHVCLLTNYQLFQIKQRK